MKNESNTGNSPSAIRKSRTFALAAALLSTLVFASAAHACDTMTTNNGGYATLCAETNDSGKVYLWDTLNSSWQLQAFYRGRNAQYVDIYYYGAQVWAVHDRATYEIGWVAYAKSGWMWIPYIDYSAQLVNAAQALLAALPQSPTPPSTPMIPMVVSTILNDYCADVRALQESYTARGYPIIHYYTPCGF